MLSPAITPPSAVGPNVTITFRELPAPIAKETELTLNWDRVERISLIERKPLPVLEIVSVAVVELPTETSPKDKIPVETEMLGAATGVTTTGAAGATPVPDRDTVTDPSS